MDANLIKNRPDLNEDALLATRTAMDNAVLDALVTDYEHLIPALTLPDRNDRHVLAAAIQCHASGIVTFNEKDFPEEILKTYGMHTRHPDEFLLDVIGIDEEGCINAIQADISHYKAPPLTVDDYLASLDKAGVPKTAAFLREVKVVFT